MRKLTWEEYLKNFDNWSESTRESYVKRIEDFTGASHMDVAGIINCIYNQTAASRLANMAMDAGVRFDSNDISLDEFAVDAATLSRMKATKDDQILRKQQKKRNREDFWTGVSSMMVIDLAIDAIFGKKEKK